VPVSHRRSVRVFGEMVEAKEVQQFAERYVATSILARRFHLKSGSLSRYLRESGAPLLAIPIPHAGWLAHSAVLLAPIRKNLHSQLTPELTPAPNEVGCFPSSRNRFQTPFQKLSTGIGTADIRRERVHGHADGKPSEEEALGPFSLGWALVVLPVSIYRETRIGTSFDGV
jgi:hypothetical protein